MLEIDSLMKEALKNRDKDSLRVFKEIKTEILKLKTAPNPVPYTDSEEFKLLKALRKQHMESLKCCMEAGREDLAQQENKDIDLYTKLLPQPATPAEINAFIDTLNQEITKTTMSAVISAVKSKFPANEGKQIATIIKYRIEQ